MGTRKCKNWLDSYMLYSEHQESPSWFHEWVGLFTLASAMEQRVWMDKGSYKIYPNMYVVLVARSARCRKSTAVALGMRLLGDLEPGCTLIPHKVTNEALINVLSTSGRIDPETGESRVTPVISASELSVFIGREKRFESLVDTLTHLYDWHKRMEYQTLARGNESIDNVCAALLGASTFEWLKDVIGSGSILGGFASRVIFVYAEKSDRSVPCPEDYNHISSKHRKDLAADLQHIHALVRGQFKVSPEARKWYIDWYHGFDPDDELISGYLGRKHTHLYKIAMALAVSEGDRLVIEKRHFVRAMELLDKMETHLRELYSQMLEDGEASDMRFLLSKIPDKGYMRKSALLNATFRRVRNPSRLNGLLQQLQEMDKIEVKALGGNIVIAKTSLGQDPLLRESQSSG